MQVACPDQCYAQPTLPQPLTSTTPRRERRSLPSLHKTARGNLSDWQAEYDMLVRCLARESTSPEGDHPLATLTVAAVMEFLEQFAPLSLAADWDNVGLL